MTPKRVRIVRLLLIAPLTAACAADPDQLEGECNARIGWEGVVYTPHNMLNDAAPTGERLGRGNALYCDGSTVITTVEVFAIDGVDPSVAIAAKNEWRSVYVAEGTPRSSWPEAIAPR